MISLTRWFRRSGAPALVLLICGTAVYAPSYALDFSLELLGAGAATPGAGHILQGYVGDFSLTTRNVAVGCRGLGLGWNNNADSSFSLISALLVPRVSVYPLVVLGDERAIMLEIYSEYNWYREAMNARTAAVGIKARYNRGPWGLAILGSRVFRFGSDKGGAGEERGAGFALGVEAFAGRTFWRSTKNAYVRSTPMFAIRIPDLREKRRARRREGSVGAEEIATAAGLDEIRELESRCEPDCPERLVEKKQELAFAQFQRVLNGPQQCYDIYKAYLRLSAHVTHGALVDSFTTGMIAAAQRCNDLDELARMAADTASLPVVKEAIECRAGEVAYSRWKEFIAGATTAELPKVLYQRRRLVGHVHSSIQREEMKTQTQKMIDRCSAVSVLRKAQDAARSSWVKAAVKKRILAETDKEWIDVKQAGTDSAYRRFIAGGKEARAVPGIDSAIVDMIRDSLRVHGFRVLERLSTAHDLLRAGDTRSLGIVAAAADIPPEGIAGLPWEKEDFSALFTLAGRACGTGDRSLGETTVRAVERALPHASGADLATLLAGLNARAKESPRDYCLRYAANRVGLAAQEKLPGFSVDTFVVTRVALRPFREDSTVSGCPEYRTRVGKGFVVGPDGNLHRRGVKCFPEPVDSSLSAPDTVDRRTKIIRSESTVESLLRMWSTVGYNDAEIRAVKQLAKLGCLKVRTIEIESIKKRKLHYRIPQGTAREVAPVAVCTERIRKTIEESELVFLGVSPHSR